MLFDKNSLGGKSNIGQPMLHGSMDGGNEFLSVMKTKLKEDDEFKNRNKYDFVT